LTIEIEEIKKTYTDDRPENCEGVLGYEEEPYGDGLKGFYYDNEDFIGSPKKFIDDDINFDWNGEPPKEGINHENFSVRWEGILKAPVTGKYKFTSISDDGASIYLNELMILTHNMHGMGDPKISWMTVMHHEDDSQAA